MATQLLIKRGSNALSDTRVEFDDTIDARTDANGLVHLDLEPGAHRLRVEVDGNTLDVPFRLEGNGELHVLDIDELLEDAMRQTAGLPDDVPLEVAERYRVQQVLGRGGMGIVVRAWDTLLERQVAIKFLNEKMAAHDEAQEIFLKEARSLARLRHDCLVDVHDVSVDDGRPIMVTEFVEGDNLASVLSERGPLDGQTVLSLAESVCEGLAHMHDHGLIHRDIKPANIILQPDGHLKLIDFGLARSLEHLVSQGTQVRGTPAYMAPEQVKGDELGPATDIYQLGVTLFELASGTIPFPDDPYGLAHVEESVPTLESRGVDPEPSLVALIDACLQKDPSERPADATVILEHLRAAPGRRTSKVAPTTSDLGASVPPWAITATSTVAVVGLAALAWIYIGGDKQDARSPEDLRDAAPPVRPTDPPTKSPPPIGDAVDDASARVSDALGLAARDADNTELPDESDSGAPQRRRGAGTTADPIETESGPTNQQQQQEPAPAPTKLDAGAPTDPAAETKPASETSDDMEVSEDVGTAQPDPEEPAPAEAPPSEKPEDESEDNSADEPADESTDDPTNDSTDDSTEDSSKKEPPNPRFF